MKSAASFIQTCLPRLTVPAVVMALISFGNASPASAQTVTSCEGAEAFSAQCNVFEDMVGTWLYTVTIPVPGQPSIVFSGTETYTPGGTYTEADQLSFTPGYLATPGHGVWEPTGSQTFALTYVNLTYADGAPTGTSKVRQLMRVTPDGNRYVGSGNYTYFHNDGTVSAHGTFTVRATRIQVEKP